MFAAAGAAGVTLSAWVRDGLPRLARDRAGSAEDVVAVFRGVAMTGDIEFGTLESVNAEVPEDVRRRSMDWLKHFPDRWGYRVHSVVSAHRNDVRVGIDWPALFDC